MQIKLLSLANYCTRQKNMSELNGECVYISELIKNVLKKYNKQ
jgi:hypothetical protein